MSEHYGTATAIRHRLQLLACGGLWVFATAVFLLFGCAPSSPSDTSPGPTPKATAQHWKGNANASVVIEEWTDLQ